MGVKKILSSMLYQFSISNYLLMKKPMKKIPIFLLFILGCTVRIYGQGPTGINTKTPLQQLHVAGTSSSGTVGATGIQLIKPTILIEGLSKAKNPAIYAIPAVLSAAPLSLTGTVVQPVSVTQDGDLLLNSRLPIPLVATALGTDELPTPIPVTEVPDGNNSSELLLKAYTFTLTQRSMVHFLASVSVSVYVSGSTSLTDGINRAYHAVFKFTSTVPAGLVTTNVNFAQDGASYTNTSGTTSGDMYLQPEAYLVLPKGTYTVQLVGRIFGYDLPARAVFGQGSVAQNNADMVSIIATPL